MFEADGKTSKKDVKNPNEKLRSRPVQGLTHITNLTYKDGNTWMASCIAYRMGTVIVSKGN
jgi:hypothetical protein